MMLISKTFFPRRSPEVPLADFVRHDGFSLVEVLVASVIVAIAALAATAAFNVIIQSISGTTEAADRNRKIDTQVATINEMSELYTSCAQPMGEIPLDPATVCGGSISPRTSFYYFPSYQDSAKVTSFFQACKSATPSDHITAYFVTAVNSIQSPGGSVSEPVAARVDSADAANHLVEVTWRRTSDSAILRQIQIAPVVTSWCP